MYRVAESSAISPPLSLLHSCFYFFSFRFIKFLDPIFNTTHMHPLYFPDDFWNQCIPNYN